MVHLVNRAGATTVPWQLAVRMRERGVDAWAASWYGEPGGGEPGVGLGARRWWDPGAARRLAGHLRSEEPDVLHLHHTASAAAGAVVARLAGRPPTVKTEHNNRARKRTGQYALDLVSLALADAVVGNSDATLASFRPWERAVTRGKRRRIYNGVDLEAIEAAGQELSPSGGTQAGDPPVVACVGRLVRQKNHGRLLRAVRIALDRGERAFRLMVAGDGPLRPVLERTAAELGVADRVDFRGTLSRREVYRVLWRSDAFVMPSLWEGFCNAAVEAMAAALPVVASDIPVLREVVGEAGRYFDPGRPEEIADALVGVLTAPRERQRRMGQALRERAREQFGLDRTVDEHLELYRELSGGRSRGRDG